MLTIKSRMIGFKDRDGQQYTADELDKLTKALVMADIINFRGNISHGFTAGIASQIIGKMTTKGTVVILNDVTLQMTYALLEAGYDVNDIYLVFGKWEKNALPSADQITYTIMKNVIENNIAEKLNIITIEELFKMNTKFDCVIANPPYGAIGANITKKIIDNVEFVEYANLMPMVDYEKCRKYNLWHNVELDNIGHCPGGFEDAGISPIICKINKAKVNSLDADSFRIVCLENKLTQKYFKVNIARKDTFNIAEQFQDTDLAKTIALPLRTKSGNHSGQANLGKTEASQFFLINNNIKSTVSAAETKSICCTTIVFKSASEKQNVTNFLYSNIGYKFASWLMTGMNRDSFHLREHHFWFPKVDWTRSWTVEEILADYGYDADEIQAVMDDLKNYKGMED